MMRRTDGQTLLEDSSRVKKTADFYSKTNEYNHPSHCVHYSFNILRISTQTAYLISQMSRSKLTTFSVSGSDVFLGQLDQGGACGWYQTLCILSGFLPLFRDTTHPLHLVSDVLSDFYLNSWTPPLF